MAQMAIRGYEVQALDFVVKPVNYYSFAMKMTNAFRMLKNRKSRTIVLTTTSGMLKISTDDLYYVESERTLSVLSYKGPDHPAEGIHERN